MCVIFFMAGVLKKGFAVYILAYFHLQRLHEVFSFSLDYESVREEIWLGNMVVMTQSVIR